MTHRCAVLVLLAMTAAAACSGGDDSPNASNQAGRSGSAGSSSLGGDASAGHPSSGGDSAVAGESPTESSGGDGSGGEQPTAGAAGDSAAPAGSAGQPSCDPNDPTTFPSLPAPSSEGDGVTLDAVFSCTSVSLQGGVADPATGDDEPQFSAAWGRVPYAGAHELVDASLRISAAPGTDDYRGLLQLISPNRETQRWLCLAPLQTSFYPLGEGTSAGSFPATFATSGVSELACDPSAGAAYDYSVRVSYRVDAPPVVCSPSGLCQVSFAFPDDVAKQKTLFVNVEADWPRISTFHPSFDYSDTLFVPFASSYILYRDDPGKVSCGGVGVVSKYAFHSYGDPFRGPDTDETAFSVHIDALADPSSCPGVALPGSLQGSTHDPAPAQPASE